MLKKRKAYLNIRSIRFNLVLFALLYKLARLKYFFSCYILLLLFANCFGQNTEAPTLRIISSNSKYYKSIASDPNQQMVELKKNIPNITYDLRYAQINNFTNQRLYRKNLSSTYLRKAPAEALANIAKELQQMNIGILVWDAYRPYSVTQKFWKLIHDERYVANPKKGSGHNRGIAIDMSLLDLKTGKELDMPTDFDDFSEKAHHGFPNLSAEKIKNREFLRNIMEKYGFIKFETEWWHYYWPGGNNYDLLDIPFSKLK